MKNTVLTILLLCGTLIPAFPLERRDSLEFRFRQGKSVLDPDFGSNRRSIDSILSVLEDPRTEAARLRGVRIIGSASPEGSVPFNYALSRRRADEIVSRFPGLEAEAVPTPEIEFVGRNWRGLREIALNDASIPGRDELIAVLDAIIAQDERMGHEEVSAHNLEKIKKIRGGETYRYLYGRWFPSLRFSRVQLDWQIVPKADWTLTGPETAAVYATDGDRPHLPLFFIGTTDPQGTSLENNRKGERNFYMALKTNMLYDAAALPTIGAEFYLGRNFSVGANWTYGWWDNNHRHRYWRAYGGDLNLRWWFGPQAARKPLTGHHIGVYGGITTYDFEFGGKGYMGGIPGGTLWDRNMKLAGVEYGFSLPVASRLNIDFTIGVGYMGGKVVKYEPHGDNYLWLSTSHVNWFGPTKAEISLVWLIGKGNLNMKGGGR